tara:strand:+ start:1781 stop:2350 length:570 start_codon:yes stop_codon:yes gene_type:complete
MSTSKLIDAPIPGENYTSDTRNYPWHRPPDLVGYDEILEYLIGKISKEKPTDRLFAMLEYGVDVSTLTSILMLSHIGKGKFSVDMALLTAGPFARYVQIYAESNGVKVDMGIEDNSAPATVEDLKVMAGLMDDEDPTDEQIDMATASPEDPIASEGLMGMPDPNAEASLGEQDRMLGYNEEEPIDEEVV